jgi:glycerol kinase
LCNAIVWDDARTNGVVRAYEKKLEEEGIDIDEEDITNEAATAVGMGTGKLDAAIGDKGPIDDGVGTVGKVMEGLGLAGRGKESKKRRKGKDGLVDV